VVISRNQLLRLKLVNRASFKTVNIFPNLTFNTITLTSDVTFYLRPPAAVLLQLDDIADLIIPGLPKGTIIVKSKTVAILESLQGKHNKSRGKPGFR